MLATAIVGTGLASMALAQSDEPPAARPRSAKRLLRVFDFEEPTNPYPVPLHWFRPQDNPAGLRRPGYPKYNEAQFDKSLATSGKTSVKLPTMGGSTALRLEAGEVPIFPDADYTVSAKVQTAGLEHARAFLTARLLDQHSNPIPGAEVRSAPVLSPGGWETVQILLTGSSPAAAWLQIDLELLQPKEFEPLAPEAIRKHFVAHEDVIGAAYFDDVSIALVPRTRFWATQRSGIFVAPERPTIGMLVRDQGGEELAARVRVLDIDGKSVAEETFKLDPSARASIWTPALPGYGWFRAILDIDAAEVSVTRQEIWICSLPERLKLVNSSARVRDLARFGIIADDTPEQLLPQIPAIAQRIGTRFITLPAFDAAQSADQQGAVLAARTGTIDALLAQGQQVTLTVGDVPPDLAALQVLDATDTLGMCEHDSKTWAPFMEPILDVFGQQILRYQLGHTGDTHAMRRDPTLGTESFERSIARLVPGPRILLPWRADHPIPLITRSTTTGKSSEAIGTISSGPLVDELAMEFPIGFAPGAMRDLSLVWRDQVAGGNAIGLTVVPELPELDRYGPKARATELARRVVEFWGAMGTGAATAGVDSKTIWPRIAISSPWRIAAHPGEAEPMLHPGPALGAMSQLADRLAGRRIITTIPGPAGVRAMLIAEAATGSGGSADEPALNDRAAIGNRAGDTLLRACVVAWADGAEPDHAWVDVYPARDGVDVVDIFGNSTRVGLSGSGGKATAQVRVPLTDSPVFIEGVDPYLVQFTSSFKLTPTFIPAVVAEHDMRIEMTNPWPIRITGQIQLKEPDNAINSNGMSWTISPNVIDFAIAPGQTTSLPLQLTFGPGQLAGVKDMVMVARVLADRQYPSIRTTTSIEVGLSELELIPDVQLSPSPDGPDVIVTAAITNRDTRPRTLRLDLAAPETPGQQLQISALPPSQTAYKRFIIRDGARLLGGKRIRITLGDEESAARLSKAALVPKPQ